MAHWAEIDENNIVLRVLAMNNDKPNEGFDWLVENLGGTWIQTSYNTFGGVHKLGGLPLRKNYAGIGFTYDKERDAFISPKPEPIVLEDGTISDWILNEFTCLWENSALS